MRFLQSLFSRWVRRDRDRAEAGRADQLWSMTSLQAVNELRQRCQRFGRDGKKGDEADLLRYYADACGRLDVEVRLQLLDEISLLVARGQGRAWGALLPFLLADPDLRMRQASSTRLAALVPAPASRPMAGPGLVLDRIAAEPGDSAQQGAAVAGVLALGDRRLLPLLLDCWRKLGPDAKAGLLAARIDHVSELLVAFWLATIEAGVEEELRLAVLAMLANLPIASGASEVVDMSRTLPAFASADSVEVLRRTSFKDHLQTIEPRLAVMERDESPPSLVELIRRNWSSTESFRPA